MDRFLSSKSGSASVMTTTGKAMKGKAMKAPTGKAMKGKAMKATKSQEATKVNAVNALMAAKGKAMRVTRHGAWLAWLSSGPYSAAGEKKYLRAIGAMKGKAMKGKATKAMKGKAMKGKP